MNDETVQNEELPVPEATSPSSAEAAAPEAADGTMTGTVAVTYDQMISIGSDIVHANLFGSFLLCGTLIGIVLFRGIYGSK